jgi:uncharacterized protein
MDNFEIKIDKDGLWYYKGAHMFRKEILSIFFDHLKIDECGNYLIELGPERCYIEVEDTAFVVTAVYKTTSPGSHTQQIEVLLNDETCEILDMNSLQTGGDNVLYCRVKKGRFDARFTRKAYYQLAEFIEASDDNDNFYISLNGEKYFIMEAQDL